MEFNSGFKGLMCSARSFCEAPKFS